jgi:hypothetical protein
VSTESVFVDTSLPSVQSVDTSLDLHALS